MEQWQVDELNKLMGTELREVESGSRIYSSSKTYGDSRFHMLSRKSGSIQIEQTNVDDKWGSRVIIQEDQFPEFLKTLITWHLDDVRKQQEYAQQSQDALGDLDNCPF